jgi:hypothetical protein
MRTRLLGFAAALILAALGVTAAPAAQADLPRVDAQTCVSGGGSVEYDASSGQWICIGGTYDTQPIT